MKNFISENWYKLMIGTSLLMASFGFMVYTITPANAKDSHDAFANPNYKLVPVNTDGTISVKLSDEQVNKIIPKNEDGSINIRLSQKQLQALEPNTVQSVNIAEILGTSVAAYPEYTDNGGYEHYSLGIRETHPW